METNEKNTRLNSEHGVQLEGKTFFSVKSHHKMENIAVIVHDHSQNSKKSLVFRLH